MNDTLMIAWDAATCEETKGMIGEEYIRCGAPAVMQVQHNGRTEGPYLMCLVCGTHNVRNRDARVIATKPDTALATTDTRIATKPQSVREQLAVAAAAKMQAADAFVVTPETFAEAGELLRGLRAQRKQWAEYWDPHIEGAKEAKRVAEANRKRSQDDKDKLDVPLGAAEGRLAKRIGDVEDAIEQARLREEAERQAAEAKRAEEATLQAAIAIEEELKTATPEQAPILAAELEQVLDDPFPVATVTVAREVPKVAGMSRPEQWGAELVSLRDLLTAMVGGKLDKPLTDDLTKRIGEAIMPPLNQRAKALKSALKIPGVRAKSDKGYRLR